MTFDTDTMSIEAITGVITREKVKGHSQNTFDLLARAPRGYMSDLRFVLATMQVLYDQGHYRHLQTLIDGLTSEGWSTKEKQIVTLLKHVALDSTYADASNDFTKARLVQDVRVALHEVEYSAAKLEDVLLTMLLLRLSYPQHKVWKPCGINEDLGVLSGIKLTFLIKCLLDRGYYWEAEHSLPIFFRRYKTEANQTELERIYSAIEILDDDYESILENHRSTIVLLDPREERCITQNGSVLRIVDTPGLGDQDEDNFKLWKQICETLRRELKSKQKGSYVVYLIDESSNEINKADLKHVQALKLLVGDRNWSKVSIVFTHGTTSGEDDLDCCKKIEKDLMEKYVRLIFGKIRNDDADIVLFNLDYTDKELLKSRVYQHHQNRAVTPPPSYDDEKKNTVTKFPPPHEHPESSKTSAAPPSYESVQNSAVGSAEFKAKVLQAGLQIL
ncbi:hypothetical protein E4T43_06399 [Aureobasidium subglaciale]|nr:hypothetical protein E4T43_06399 [Aureobasidium subglaciale]